MSVSFADTGRGRRVFRLTTSSLAGFQEMILGMDSLLGFSAALKGLESFVRAATRLKRISKERNAMKLIVQTSAYVRNQEAYLLDCSSGTVFLVSTSHNPHKPFTVFDLRKEARNENAHRDKALD